MALRALIFDVDGTLADTERDGHRVAFNAAFAQAGLAWHWNEVLYGELLQVSGGVERMLYYRARLSWIDRFPWRAAEARPAPAREQDAALHRAHRRGRRAITAWRLAPACAGAQRGAALGHRHHHDAR
jgi:phosphoglycolate phosphatase-like HAD superfamily hydrolase